MLYGTANIHIKLVTEVTRTEDASLQPKLLLTCRLPIQVSKMHLKDCPLVTSKPDLVAALC